MNVAFGRRGRRGGAAPAAEESVASPSPLARARARVAGWRQGFRHWRRSRPFWAGVITLAAAYELVAVPHLKLGGVTIQQGIAGIATWLMAALMALMAMVMWFQPQLRVIAGVSTILFALASFLTSNLGGFLLGMLLGLVGGSLAVGWDVDKPKAEAPAEQIPADDEPSDGDDVRGLDLVRPEDAGDDAAYGAMSDQPTQPQPKALPGGRGEQESLASTPASGQVSDGTATR
jgi:Family of unknown function (DUF6114)